MNIFLPYEDNVEHSVSSLDDVRLNKQAVECYQLLTMAEREKELGEPTSKGHYHHPVYQFYKSNPQFLVYYGYQCCQEYCYRFKKWIAPTHYFESIMEKYGMIIDYDLVSEGGWRYGITKPEFTPYYMEGSKDSPNCIRTTENVSRLFQDKLCKKWDNDKANGRPPKWTNRQAPEFYKEG